MASAAVATSIPLLGNGPPIITAKSDIDIYTQKRLAALQAQLDRWEKSEGYDFFNRLPDREYEPKLGDASAAISRILQCGEKAHHDVLGITKGAGEKEILAAWLQLGCLVRPEIRKAEGNDLTNARKAYVSKSISTVMQAVSRSNQYRAYDGGQCFGCSLLPP